LKPTLGLLLAALSLLALVPVAQAATTSGASGPSSGYVSYSVQAAINGTTHSASFNESVTPSSAPGKSILFFAVKGSETNFTYSHVVNASSALFPYLPAISNENYTYSANSTSVVAKISEQGTSQITFQGSAYTLTNYAFSATMTSSKGNTTVAGTVSIFPSDLVYSVSAQSPDGSATATLTSTSLALAAATAAPAIQAASAGLGISIAVGAVALSLGVRMKRKRGPAGGSNPDHWVD